MPTRHGPLTVPGAYRFITEVVSYAETQFVVRYNRHPSLVKEQDYVSLADFLNIPDIDNKNRYRRNLDGYTHLCPAIPAHDIAHVLLRRFLVRQGLFAEYKTTLNKMLFDALMGRLSYNVPANEYAHRLTCLARLQARDIPFPSDLRALKENLRCVSEACFLPTIYQKVYRKPKGDVTRKGYACIGTCIVNPTKNYLQLLEYLNPEKYGYDVFIGYYQELQDAAHTSPSVYR